MPRAKKTAVAVQEPSVETPVKVQKRKKKSSENREFRLHKDILWSIIQSQAGSLGKAILELVMNSIDAGATAVSIDIKSNKVSVMDDGKGFCGREEIEQFFETFGTPHEKGDATYGRFRMGRGQIMAFSRNVWHSGEFSMDVDIKERGLNYELSSMATPYKGCAIEADLYDAMTTSEVLTLMDSLRSLCRYAPIPVVMNKERISIDLTKEKWSFEDENAYYVFRAGSRSLSVYNLGIHVVDYPSSQYGIGGMVISKRQLEVNFARNDILISKCETWKSCVPVIRAEAKRHEEKKPVQNEEWREMLSKQLVSGAFESREDFLKALEKCKVFTDYSGKNYSFSAMRDAIGKRAGHVVVVNDYSLKADRVHQRSLAFVVSPKTLARLGYMKFKEFIERLESHAKNFANPTRTAHGYEIEDWEIRHVIDQCKYIASSIVPLEQVASVINEQHDIVDEKDLDKEEKLFLSVIKEVDYSMWNTVDMKPRKIRVCRSETVDGYTDGSSVIFIERKFLKLRQYDSMGAFAAFDKIKYLLLHEYLHDDNDSTGHGHPPEFYERFHDLLRNPRLDGYTAYAVKRWFAARRRAGISMRHSDKEAANALFVETDEKVA